MITTHEPDRNEACVLPSICNAVGLPAGARLVEVLDRIRIIQSETARYDRWLSMVN